MGKSRGPAFAHSNWRSDRERKHDVLGSGATESPACCDYGPYMYAPYAVQPNAGEVKIDTKVKEAEVFINGSLAGTAGKLKKMTLPAGSYNIEVREPGRSPFGEKVYVVAGKTIHLYPDMP